MTGAITGRMRALLGALVLTAAAMTSMVGCSGDEDTASTPRKSTKDTKDNGSSGTTDPNGTNTTNTVSAAVTACTALAAPTSLADVKDASDLRIAGTAIFFQTGTSITRVLKNGTKKSILTSPNLTHSWVDAKGVLAIEQTAADNPNATLRAFNANAKEAAEDNPNPSKDFPEFTIGEGDQIGGATSATNFNAASAKVFASDDTNYYLTADDGDGNTLIVAVNRNDPNNRATLATIADRVIVNPQIASAAIWYVERNNDDNRIFKIALATDDQPAGEKKEVFGMQQQCNLVVNESSAFCSIGASIEQRDLTGGTPKTLFQVSASKTADAPFGQATYFDGSLYVGNTSPDAEIKNVIRAIGTGAADEKLVACNRAGAIKGIAVDSANIVWAEDGVGVFMGAR